MENVGIMKFVSLIRSRLYASFSVEKKKYIICIYSENVISHGVYTISITTTTAEKRRLMYTTILDRSPDIGLRRAEFKKKKNEN